MPAITVLRPDDARRERFVRPDGVERWHRPAELVGTAVAESWKIGVRRAEELYGVPRSVISRGRQRMGPPPDPAPATEAPTRLRAHSRLYVLSDAEEQLVVDYAVAMAKANACLSTKQLGIETMRLLEQHPRVHRAVPVWEARGGPTSKFWRGFLKRHPELSRRFSDPRGQKRHLVCKEDFMSLYDNLKAVSEELGDKWEAEILYNLDETNFRADQVLHCCPPA